jgi:UDP-N-acetylglucosamine 2-epimerase (non-hydrolysing)
MKVAFVFGTRPEAIKMAPLILKFKENKNIQTSVITTGQHREMVNQVLDFFDIKPDINLDIMKHNQTLEYITSSTIEKLNSLFENLRFDIVFVQGDTTTAFASALVSFYKRLKVAHIEAGLRSFNKHSPFPEEINRVLISKIADYHFAPTETAKRNLYKEGIKKNVYVVGNTVTDALLMAVEKVKNNMFYYEKKFDFIDKNKKVILVTGHRRESFGKPFENICHSIKKVAKDFDVEIVYPAHLNPNVRKPVMSILSDMKNVHIIDPVDYPSLVYLMYISYLILTDSGGIQEEAPSLGKPVLVMREVTERIEGIKAGTARLVGTDPEKIYKYVAKLIKDKNFYSKMSKAINPYGDGKVSEKIYKIITTS